MDYLEHALSMEWRNAVAGVRVAQRKLDRMVELGDLTEEQYSRITQQPNYALEDLLYGT